MITQWILTWSLTIAITMMNHHVIINQNLLNQKNYPKDKIFSKEFGVEKMMQVIDSVEEEDNGKFYAWDGQEIPW